MAANTKVITRKMKYSMKYVWNINVDFNIFLQGRSFPYSPHGWKGQVGHTCCKIKYSIALWVKPFANIMTLAPIFSSQSYISENMAAKVTKHVARSNSLKGAHWSPKQQKQLKNCYLEKQTKNPKARIRVVMLFMPSVFCSMMVVFVLNLFSNKRIHLTL